MFLRKAQGYHFRNYKEFSIEFNSLINIFTGENGQGKSSFLEALYCGLRGKSFHPFISSQFIQNERDKTQIQLTLEEDEGQSHLSASFSPSETGLKKEILYCGKKVGSFFLEKKFPSFVFTEASMKYIRQGFDQRRFFVDEMLCFGDKNQAREKFNRVLKQKQSLLKNIRQKLLPLDEANLTLTAINHHFLQASFHLVQERLKTLNCLFSSMKDLKSDFFNTPLPNLDFSYSLSKGSNIKKDKDIFLLLKEDLEKKKELEIQTGGLLSGPQKHEISFLFQGEDSRVFCSKGEQRIFMLSLLASAVRQIPKAFLFLDDVLLELDEKTQNKLLKFLEKNHCQTFLTNCKVISFKTKKTSFFAVKNGTIKRYD